MDVLYLFPLEGNASATTALGLDANRKHVKQRLRIINGRSQERQCFCVRVPQSKIDNSKSWNFSIDSKPGSDIHLPLGSNSSLKLTFMFVYSQDQPDDPPRLIMRTDGQLHDGEVLIRNPLTEQEKRTGFQEPVLNKKRYLHDPQWLSFSTYEFAVSKPGENDGVPQPETWRQQMRVAVSVNPESREREWQNTGTELGHGSFGTVDLVRGPRTGAVRACKRIQKPIDTTDNSDVLKEINHMMRLNHRHVLPCYFPGKERLNRSILLRACHGSLAELVEQRLANPLAALVARQVGSALSYIHQNGMLHRDIKPSNILFRVAELGDTHFNRGSLYLSENENAHVHFYITDFGLARLSGSSCHTACGTPIYMAPEIRGYEGDAYTNAVDVYSFGMTLWETLAGPHGLANMRAYRRMPRHTSFQDWFSTGNEEYTRYVLQPGPTMDDEEDLLKHVLRMLHFDPSRRPSSSELDRAWTRTQDPEVPMDPPPLNSGHAGDDGNHDDGGA